MGSRSEPVIPPTADHVIAMCNGGIKAICNGTATVVKDAPEPTEPVLRDVGYTEEPTISPISNDVGPVCPRLIITDVDGVVFDQWEDFIDGSSSNDGSDQSDLPTVIEVSAGMNIQKYLRNIVTSRSRARFHHHHHHHRHRRRCRRSRRSRRLLRQLGSNVGLQIAQNKVRLGLLLIKN